MSNSLRILLVSPKGQTLCHSREFEDFMLNSREMQTIMHFWNGIGVALPTIAALTPPNHTVEVIDENQQNIDFDMRYDIVGITAMTQQADRAYNIADEFRKRGTYVAIGGIHATVEPEEAGSHCDTVIIGEAEGLWPQFIVDFMAGQPKSRYAQNNTVPVDMRTIPVPRYDLLSRYRYPVVYVQATRGCPHDCEFCVSSNVYGKKYRHKSVEQVVAEIKEIRKYWKTAQIGFADDNMFANKRFSRALVEQIRALNISWFAVCDVSVAEDPGFLQDLHTSGCRTLLIGFESTSKRNLHSINKDNWKQRKFDLYPEYIQRIQSNGIGVYGSFIIGLDLDDSQTIEDTIEFIGSNNLLGAQITILTPFPGSRLRRRLELEQRIIHSDWRWYTVWNAVIRHPRFTPEELERSLLYIYRQVYDPTNNLKRLRHFRQVCERLVDSYS